MAYYIFYDKNIEKLNGAGQCSCIQEEVENIEVSEDIYSLYNETPDKYIYLDGEIVENPNYEEEQAQQEQDRINNLTMTALDFIGVLQGFGLTLEEINAYLENNLAVKMQLTYCQNVYCGVVKQLMPITVGDIIITTDMVEIAFRVKHGEDIKETDTLVVEETVNGTRQAS